MGFQRFLHTIAPALSEQDFPAVRAALNSILNDELHTLNGVIA